jgi:hypothetical protein
MIIHLIGVVVHIRTGNLRRDRLAVDGTEVRKRVFMTADAMPVIGGKPMLR